MNTPLLTPFGEFTLVCDNANDPSIQAWSQADAYLLRLLDDEPAAMRGKVAVINDDWGALAVATQAFAPLPYSDSAIYRDWLARNLGLADTTVHGIEQLARSPATFFLMRLPKNLHFFRHQLSLLSCLPDITVYVAGMQKYWPASFFEAAHDYFADVEFYPGIRKAKAMRLGEGKANREPQPEQRLECPEFGLAAINYPNVFSRDSLDIGTRFFLENFPDLSACSNVLDLACGNGLLGIKALQAFPQLQGWFVDESHYATLSCRASLKANAIDENRYTVLQNNILHGLSLPPMDAILCNPPFHQQHRIGDHIASAMMAHSARVLAENGRLYLIGNRHLNYNLLLGRHFSQVNVHAANSKFVILKAMR